jgi:hypothetical protein
MSAATKAVNTIRAASGEDRAFEYTVKTGNTVYAGAMTAVGTDGKAVPAADATGLQVVGVAQNTAAAGEKVQVISGDFWVPVYSGSTMSVGSSLRAKAYVKTDNDVALTGEVTNSILAGIVYEFDASGKARVAVGVGAKA